jgi:hypothetical protein
VRRAVSQSCDWNLLGIGSREKAVQSAHREPSGIKARNASMCGTSLAVRGYPP